MGAIVTGALCKSGCLNKRENPRGVAAGGSALTSADHPNAGQLPIAMQYPELKQQEEGLA